MNDNDGVKFYPPAEEKINILSHAFGLVLSVIALPALVWRAALGGGIQEILVFAVFGLSLVLLYGTSTLYHGTTEPNRRAKLRIVDHAMIYVLIAGSYTPLTLVTIKGTFGWVLFTSAWAMAITGITLKFFLTGRFEKTSTAMYLLMGWILVFAIDPLMKSLSLDGLYWLLAGGLAYTVGAILYAIKSIPFNHAIFHLFVLAGSTCHFITVFFYVLPSINQ